MTNYEEPFRGVYIVGRSDEGEYSLVCLSDEGKLLQPTLKAFFVTQILDEIQRRENGEPKA